MVAQFRFKEQNLSRELRGCLMTKLDDRTIANMDVALERACRVFPNGGDHERRKYVAQKLTLSARKGNNTLGGLSAVANAAVEELAKRKQGKSSKKRTA
jgi:hypothetical protein